MKFKVVRTLDQQAWREFITEHPAASIFHSPEMFQVFERVKGHTPHLWAAIDDSGKVFALFTPVEVTLKDGLLSSLTTRMIAYGSVLYALDPIGEAALNQLLQTYCSQVGQGALFTELRNLFDLSGVQPILESCRFNFEGHLNYLIDLDRSVDEIMQGIGKRTRKQIRRGLRQGNVVISQVSQPEQLDAWYQVLQETYDAARVPLGDKGLFTAAFDILQPRGMIKLLLASVDDKLVSCSAELLFKDIIYGWYGGTDRAYSAYVPNELLIWHLLEWGALNGYRVYDFGGAGKPGEVYGVRDFKAKFGGDLVNYGRNTYVHAPNRLKLSKLGYEVYQRLLHKGV